MKNNFRTALLALTCLLSFQFKTMAQANDSASLGVTKHTENYKETNSDRGNWGLLGLVGLIGLAGLTKKNVVDKKVEFRDRPIR